jgi:hypothetical protein
MKRTLILTAIALGAGLVAAASCRRSDLHVALIDV